MKNFKTFGTAFIAMFLMAGTATAQSFNASKTDDNFSVKYTGTELNYLVFEVEILGANENNSILKISDRAEGELYTQNWKPKTKLQIFKIEKQDGQQLIFNLQVGEKEYTKTFYATTRMMEKTTVQENGFVVL